MCVRTQLAPSAQTLQVGETSRISRGSRERVLNNERSCRMSRRSVSCRGPGTPLVVDSAADVDAGRNGAAAALPEADEHGEPHDDGCADKDQRALSIGEVAGVAGEADAEADDRVVGDGGCVTEAKARPVVEEIAAGGEQEQPGDAVHVRQQRAHGAGGAFAGERDKYRERHRDDGHASAVGEEGGELAATAERGADQCQEERQGAAERSGAVTDPEQEHRPEATLAPQPHGQVCRQAEVLAEQGEQSGERERGAGRKACPGDRACDRGDAVADRQADEREEAEEADRD